MICKINGNIIDIHKIGPPAMNFGQKSKFKGFEELYYEYIFSKTDFVRLTQKWFEGFRLEAIEDAENDIPGEFPVFDQMNALGYPKIEELLLNHNDLLSEIILFCDLDILNLIDMNTQNNDIQKSYLIQSIDWAKVDEKVSFGGIVVNISE